jgi:hypothetical protein
LLFGCAIQRSVICSPSAQSVLRRLVIMQFHLTIVPAQFGQDGDCLKWRRWV